METTKLTLIEIPAELGEILEKILTAKNADPEPTPEKPSSKDGEKAAAKDGEKEENILETLEQMQTMLKIVKHVEFLRQQKNVLSEAMLNLHWLVHAKRWDDAKYVLDMFFTLLDDDTPLAGDEHLNKLTALLNEVSTARAKDDCEGEA